MDPSARLAVDIGGTFTDLALEVGGRRHTIKVPTTPAAPEEGVMRGVTRMLAEAELRPDRVGVVIHGTTLATNAIIERKGARTALVVTEGFRDSVEMAYENRFEQYDIDVDKPEPLVPRFLRWPVRERVSAKGGILDPLDEDRVRALLPLIERHDIESIAVGLLHAYANPAHERRIADILRAARPGLWITLSSEVCPEIREYERLSTACANAYVQPLMAGYLTGLDRRLRERGFDCPLLLMTSGGGLATLETAARLPVRLVESGPAGGAILTAGIAAESGLDEVLSFDMGGTTAKICLIDDARPQTSRTFEVARVYRFTKGSGLPLRIPVIEMVEIGAGGGSIARLDSVERVRVGPDSAGAEPGPASYDRGGAAATVTDADVVLGRIDPADFAGGSVRLDAAKAKAALGRDVGDPLGLDSVAAAVAVGEIVDENMANAARVHAVERGKDLTGRTLVAFGGAAPLHATRLARKLEIGRIVVPAGAGVGAAIGFLRAPVSYEVVRSRYMRLAGFDAAAGNALLGDMEDEARRVVRLGAPDAPLEESRTAFMRYAGQGHEIAVPLPVRRLDDGDAETLQAAFDACYRAYYGRTIPGVDVEILNWALTVSARAGDGERAPEPVGTGSPTPLGRRRVFDPDAMEWIETAVFRRDGLAPGAIVEGPALIVEAQTTTVIDGRFDAHIDGFGHIVLERRGD